MHNLSVNSNDDIMNNSNPPRKSQKLENDNIINYVYNDIKNKITDMKSSDNNNNEHSEEKKHKHKHKHKKHDKKNQKIKLNLKQLYI